MHVVPRIARSSGTLPPDGVRAMFDRIAPVYDAMNRVFTMGLDGRWRRLAAASVVRPGRSRARRRVRDRGPRARRSRSGRRGDRPRLLRADARARATEVGRDRVGPRRRARAAVRRRGLRRRDDRLRDPERRRPRRGPARARTRRAAGRPARGPRDHAAKRCACARSSSSGSTGSSRWSGRVLPGGVAYSYLPASVRRFPGPDDLADALRRAGFADVSYRLLAGGIVSLHVGRR